jgi:L-amino acid N-acyltransferase YncA
MSFGDIGAYPRKVKIDTGELELRVMTRSDEAGVLAFARGLPAHDLLFLPRDISNAKVLAAWLREIEAGGMITILAVSEGAVLGCATLARDALSWSPHVGEIRVVVSRAARGGGIGRVITQSIFALAIGSGLEKLVVQMTPDQRGAIALFEGLGFRGEALLRNHVKDRDGKTHDIVVLGHDVAQVRAKLEAYGLGEV